MLCLTLCHGDLVNRVAREKPTRHNDIASLSIFLPHCIIAHGDRFQSFPNARVSFSLNRLRAILLSSPHRHAVVGLGQYIIIITVDLYILK